MTIKERAKEILKERDDYMPMLIGYLDYLLFSLIL